MPSWKLYHKDYLEHLTRSRPGETKLGERLRVGEGATEDIQFVILGIPEDIGVRANLGVGGTHTAWPAFLEAFLNIQATASLIGSNCSILGHLDCSDLQHLDFTATMAELREATSLIDQAVAPMIESITAAGKLPILIGGGHNNAYPAILGAARGHYEYGRINTPKINVINLDAHADFRPMEGRHSGNGFRYAFHEGFLDRYAMVGLHRNYNAQSMLDELAREPNLLYSFWETIFLEEKMTFTAAVDEAIEFTRSGICGIELDLDSISGVLSSAATPAGITPTQARQYLHRCAQKTNPAYLHLCEGAVKLNNGREDPGTGKLIAYLISDFMRAFSS